MPADAMRTVALTIASILATACAPEEAPARPAPVEVTEVARSPEENVEVEAPPSVEVSGAAVAALHRRALAEPDDARAAEMLEQACDRGFSASCVALAVRLEDGRGVEPDAERARGLLEQACLDGSTMACDRLGH